MAAPEDRGPAPPTRPRGMEFLEGRWAVGTPAVEGFVRRTLAAIALLTILVGVLILLSA